MNLIYIIIGLALFSLTIKIVKKLDNTENKEQNTNSNIKIKDGINLYFGSIIGKLIVLAIGIIIAIIIPIIIMS